jgi:hypothetical protein
MKLRTFIIALCVLSLPSVINAASVDTTNRYAWSENAGWIDFGTSLGAVTITDSELSGYAYGENTGWISLNCSNTSSCANNPYKVANTTGGVLSGYAWSENAGWINFAPDQGGVYISSTGVFSGYAYSETLGWINFNVDNPVTTGWRYPSTSATTPRPPSRSAALRAASIPTSTPKPLTPATAPVHSVSTITRDVTIGFRGADALSIQQYLNTHGFIVATQGAGSPGNETAYFGGLTQQALARFQAAKGITPALGYFGPKTRAYINSNN